MCLLRIGQDSKVVALVATYYARGKQKGVTFIILRREQTSGKSELLMESGKKWFTLITSSDQNPEEDVERWVIYPGL